MKNLFKKFFVWSDTDKRTKKEYDDSKPADFETALAASGFGKFNILVALIAIPTTWASMFQSTTMSYVFPAAQCDLNLTLEDKGLLNGVTFAGMVSSAFLWGFLFDIFGRRKLLIIGFLLDGVLVVLSAVAQGLTFLMITKFIGGLVIIGPFAALIPYLSELHVAEHRSRIPLLMGGCFAIGGIYLPFIASMILPMNFEQTLTENLVIRSWGIFLLINAVPSLLSALLIYFLPESPKFLMCVGKNEEAMEVFKQIYSLNSGNPEENYSIKELIKEERTVEGSSCLTRSLSNLGPLFTQYLKLFLLVCSLQVLITTSFNTFRLWLPQLFQAITDYKYYNNGTSASLCQMIGILKGGTDDKECFVNFQNSEVYFNSMSVCLTSLIGYLIAAGLVNVLGQNKLLAITSFLAGLFSVGIYFSYNSQLATVFMAGFYSLCSIGMNSAALVVINLFPTSIRTTSLSLTYMFARISSMAGNVVFPYLINMGCAPPFLMMGAFVFACSILTYILPKQNDTLK